MKVGAGRGGSKGDEAPSAVEVVDKAGDPDRADGREGRSRGPSSAFAAGGGDEGNEEIVLTFHCVGALVMCRVSSTQRTSLTTTRLSADKIRLPLCL